MLFVHLSIPVVKLFRSFVRCPTALCFCPYNRRKQSSGKQVRAIYTPLHPTFYNKTGYRRGIQYLFFLFLLQNIDCGYSLEPPRRGGSTEFPQLRRGGSNEYPQSIFWSKNKKNVQIFLMVYVKKISIYCMDKFS